MNRVPFIHFFDGFRTSHEVAKIERLRDEDLRALIDDDLVRAHWPRGLNADHPVMRGTAQNPDLYFQAREASNPFYLACPDIVQATMDRFAALVGRQYRLFEYLGSQPIIHGGGRLVSDAGGNQEGASGFATASIAVRASNSAGDTRP